MLGTLPLIYNSCFPPSDEILEWFGQHGTGHSATMPLPLHLFNGGSHWLGLPCLFNGGSSWNFPPPSATSLYVISGTSCPCVIRNWSGCMSWEDSYGYPTHREGGFNWNPISCLTSVAFWRLQLEVFPQA
ncbi:uncharacterized protein LOC126597284 [Malus sylvestris]|uniref:uncharacterized protein LOC126597284 n=1 Tax=Malus sylvestris TaxID=3752 RepID=UPI0021ABAF66|nr:uncharacterized protein LOC126597284 [Malus sylvestris]